MAPGKKNAEDLGAHIVFIDESGFLLIPSVRKTLSPRGCTPILRHRQRRDRLSVISGLSVSPKRVRTGLYFDSAEEGGKSSKDGLSESNVFGDIQLQAASENFRGGSVSNVFGDVKLDLSEIKLARGITNVFLNGIFAPKGIPFKARTNSVAGNIMVRSNKREGLFTKLEHTEGDYDKAAEKLYIQCSIVFGSINIY